MFHASLADDTKLFDLIDQAEQGKHGGDHTSKASKLDNVKLATYPTGNTRQHALRKLRKDRPVLKRVCCGMDTLHQLTEGLFVPCAETGMLRMH